MGALFIAFFFYKKESLQAIKLLVSFPLLILLTIIKIKLVSFKESNTLKIYKYQNLQ
ncbi:hypothetical protein L291_0912 [Acinetobacter guillouiae MSP4-18]|nr:hypothetical protein L291_0912 [Acinetobacter guillouiae MSP4-18]